MSYSSADSAKKARNHNLMVAVSYLVFAVASPFLLPYPLGAAQGLALLAAAYFRYRRSR